MTAARAARILLGASLVVLSCAPVYRLLEGSEGGLAGTATIELADVYLDTVWAGLLLVLPVLLLAAIVAGPAVERRMIGGLSVLMRPRMVTLAAALALLSFLLASVFALFVLEARPNHVDALAQLAQARWWSEGWLAGSAVDGEFRAMQNALFTGRGWVSQYPPGHVLVLTMFLAAGVPWAAGPALVAVTVFFGALAVERLLPERPLLARCAACLLAVSPFVLLLGASWMNHVTAAAGVTVGAWALCRAWQGSAGWAVLAGGAFGLAFATRPLSTLAAAAALTIAAPWLGPVPPRPTRMFRVVLLTLAGTAPFALLLALYNRHFFGSATTFGYDVALGPRAGLGWHVDPWGNTYGLREAVGYTSSDLLSLGVHLFETPLSAVLIVGLFLVIVRRLTAGERVLAAWAVAPLGANLLYWHHGLFMGPRMLYETAPAWIFLSVIATAHLISRLPREPLRGRLHLRPAAGLTVATALALGLLVLAPQRALSYGGSYYGITRIPVPEFERPALVFVHEGWTSRLAMTLAAAGFRLDTVETLLRQNPTCAVQQLADAVAGGDSAAVDVVLAGLDTVPRATSLPPQVAIGPGSSARIEPGEALSPECIRHAESDRLGVLSLTPLLWRGDLPGGPARGALFVRDLGPDRNAQLIAKYPDREAWLYAMPAGDAAHPVVMDYEEGMRRIWNRPLTS